MSKSSLFSRAVDFKKTYTNEVAAFVTTSAASLSLALSEVFHVPPCELCWYQRILMYPLPFIFFGAIWLKEKRTYVYVLPMAIIGAVIALYHTLVQWGIIVLPASCGGLVACDDTPINFLGFITIPFGSLIGFLAVIGLMILQIKNPKQKMKYNPAERIRLTVVASLIATLAGALALHLILN